MSVGVRDCFCIVCYFFVRNPEHYLLSFACTKESRQRKYTPTKQLFLISCLFSSRKVSRLRTACFAGVTFLKISSSFGLLTRGYDVSVLLIVMTMLLL
ncbi:hypothetical protein DB278_03250 [Pasteurella multocida]|nr:hypothetical protein DB278_03250 [Pasteurella multocida]